MNVNNANKHDINAWLGSLRLRVNIFITDTRGVGTGWPQGPGSGTLQQAVVNKLLSITNLLVQYN